MEQWLDNCIEGVDNIYEYNTNILEKNDNKSLTDYYKYYYNNDTDEIASKKHIEIVNCIANINNHHIYTYNLEKYDNKYMFIPPNTNRFHCMYLFRKMVDYCIANKYTYNNKCLIYPELKEYFYNFCFNNTYHCYDQEMKILTTRIPFKEIIDDHDEESDDEESDDESNENLYNKNYIYDESALIVENITKIYHDVINVYLNSPKCSILDKLNCNGYKKFLKFMLDYNVHYLVSNY